MTGRGFADGAPARAQLGLDVRSFSHGARTRTRHLEPARCTAPLERARSCHRARERSRRLVSDDPSARGFWSTTTRQQQSCRSQVHRWSRRVVAATPAKPSGSSLRSKAYLDHPPCTSPSRTCASMTGLGEKNRARTRRAFKLLLTLTKMDFALLDVCTRTHRGALGLARRGEHGWRREG